MATPPRRALRIALALFALGSAGGCSRPAPTVVEVAPGIAFRRDRAAGVQLLDIDLLSAHVIPTVVAEHVGRKGGNFIGDAYTVRDWAVRHHALGGMNGGFFGETYDEFGARKQLVGLTMTGGAIVAPGGFAVSTARPGEKFLRATVGFSATGVPDIAWGAGGRKGALRRYESPVNPSAPSLWPAASAVACGPRLFEDGRRWITDSEERLRSPERFARAFLAYDAEEGRPRHLVLARADAMTYSEIADFLIEYFAREHQSPPRDALCLDGGPSAQIAYRDGPAVVDAVPTGTRVPTAILLLPTPK
jgi:hypothetical protein